MRDGWKKTKGRGDEQRFEHTSGAYVRIGSDDTITPDEMAERIETAMVAAEDGMRPPGRGEAPTGALKGEK